MNHETNWVLAVNLVYDVAETNQIDHHHNTKEPYHKNLLTDNETFDNKIKAVFFRVEDNNNNINDKNETTNNHPTA